MIPLICEKCGYATLEPDLMKEHLCEVPKKLKPMSRDFFINNVASWLPDEKYPGLTLLKWERAGKITFWRGKDNFFVVKDVRTGKVVFRIDFKEVRVA